MEPSGWYLLDSEEATVSRTDRSRVFLIDPRGSVSASAVDADKLVLVRAGAWAPQRRRDRERDDRSRGSGPGSHKQEPRAGQPTWIPGRGREYPSPVHFVVSEEQRTPFHNAIGLVAIPGAEPINQLPEAARGRGGHRARPDANARTGGHRSDATAGAVWREEAFRVEADDSVSVKMWIRRGERIGFNVITDPNLTQGSRCVVDTVSGNLKRLSGDRCVGLELIEIDDERLRTRSESATRIMDRRLRGVHGLIRLRFRPFHEPHPRQVLPRGWGPKQSINRPSQQVTVQHARMDPELRRRAFAPAFANPHVKVSFPERRRPSDKGRSGTQDFWGGEEGSESGEPPPPQEKGLRIQLQTRPKRRHVVPAKWSYVPRSSGVQSGESTISRSSESASESESFSEGEVRRHGLIELRKEKVDLMQLLLRADTRRSRAAIMEELSQLDLESSRVHAKEAAEMRLPEKRRRTRSPESESSESESSEVASEGSAADTRRVVGAEEVGCISEAEAEVACGARALPAFTLSAHALAPFAAQRIALHTIALNGMESRDGVAAPSACRLLIQSFPRYTHAPSSHATADRSDSAAPLPPLRVQPAAGTGRRCDVDGLPSLAARGVAGFNVASVARTRTPTGTLAAAAAAAAAAVAVAAARST
eukprot:gene19269-biopygen28187